MPVTIRIEGPEYYIYTLKSWLKEVEDFIKEMTCIDELNVVELVGDQVRIYVDSKLVFEGLPDAEWALAEILIHELKSMGYECESE